VAVGGDEAAWVERARGETVRALEVAVREVRGPPPDEEEAWARFAATLSPPAREKLDRALELAGRKLERPAPRWERIEALCQEWLGQHPLEEEAGPEAWAEGAADACAGGEAAGRADVCAGDGADAGGEDRAADRADVCAAAAAGWGAGRRGRNRWLDSPGPDDPWAGWFVQAPGGGAASRFGPLPARRDAPPREPDRAWLDDLEARLEAETRRWADLAAVDPVPAPGGAADEPSPRRIDARLRELAAMRDRWDELLGHLGLLMQSLGLWRALGFASFGQYCEERLGMSGRAVAQRAWLERRLAALPALRRAMREGRVSYEKARVVAGLAGEGTEEAWVAAAERATCIELRRRADEEEDAQMRAHRELLLRLPGSVAELLEEALESAFRVGRREGRWLSTSERLERVAEHFVETWGALPPPRRTRSREVRERDLGHCRVPGCSRRADHAHHIVSKARGGTDDPWNLVALCVAHHLHGVHRGWVRVRGRAPDALVWELGEREEVAAAA
jgi:5-methylcytosine-specific restriction endonuclease McrA